MNLCWLASAVNGPKEVQPESRLREDLGIDDFRFFTLVLEFDALTRGDAAISLEVFTAIATARDLYLHYLTVISMPMDNPVNDTTNRGETKSG